MTYGMFVKESDICYMTLFIVLCVMITGSIYVIGELLLLSKYIPYLVAEPDRAENVDAASCMVQGVPVKARRFWHMTQCSS